MHTLKDKAVVFVKPYVNQGLAKSRATQIPFKAHTSNNAKAGIGASLFFSILAFAGVAALVTHGVAKRTSERYRNASDDAIAKVGKTVTKKAEKVKAVVEREADKATAQAKETIDKASK